MWKFQTKGARRVVYIVEVIHLHINLALLSLLFLTSLPSRHNLPKFVEHWFVARSVLQSPSNTSTNKLTFFLLLFFFFAHPLKAIQTNTKRDKSFWVCHMFLQTPWISEHIIEMVCCERKYESSLFKSRNFARPSEAYPVAVTIRRSSPVLNRTWSTFLFNLSCPRMHTLWYTTPQETWVVSIAMWERRYQIHQSVYRSFLSSLKTKPSTCAWALTCDCSFDFGVCTLTVKS